MIYRDAIIGRIKAGRKSDTVNYLRDKKEEIFEKNKLIACSAYLFSDIIILYCEHEGSLCPQNIFHDMGCFEVISINGEKITPMENIFYYSKPRDEKHWQRKGESTGIGSIARVKRNMLNSYVYYHYLLQETTTKTRDKYGIIFEFQNYLFFYREASGEKEFPSFEGSLNAEIPENWHEIMNGHFIPWQDFDGFWMPMEKIL